MKAPLRFNPARATTRELEDTFVSRGGLLEHLQTELNADATGLTTRHWQIVGARGTGKSHLTELLARRLRDHHGWEVARLPEEHYRVASVAELLEQIAGLLAGAPLESLAGESDLHRVELLALDAVRARRRTTGKPILVIVENLGALLRRQINKTADQRRLREILMRDPPFTLVATATAHEREFLDEGEPFYDFFQTEHLDDLDRDTAVELIQRRAAFDRATELLANPTRVANRLHAMFHLSGGNPRLIVALYSVLRDGVGADLYSQLLELLDQVTPYYQHRLDDVSPQMVRVITEMAVAEGPLVPSEIGRRCRLKTNQVTSNLTKLRDAQLVLPTARKDGRSRYWEIRDRLFRLWIQMREDPPSRDRLRLLCGFYEQWYDGRDARSGRGRVVVERARALAVAGLLAAGLGIGSARSDDGLLARVLDSLTGAQSSDLGSLHPEARELAERLMEAERGAVGDT